MARPDDCRRRLMWSFVTTYRGTSSQSPRVFATVEEALAAIVTKLAQHALDHEFPMISLIKVYR
jgi:hypothetical protein